MKVRKITKKTIAFLIILILANLYFWGDTQDFCVNHMMRDDFARSINTQNKLSTPIHVFDQKVYFLDSRLGITQLRMIDNEKSNVVAILPWIPFHMRHTMPFAVIGESVVYNTFFSNIIVTGNSIKNIGKGILLHAAEQNGGEIYYTWDNALYCYFMQDERSTLVTRYDKFLYDYHDGVVIETDNKIFYQPFESTENLNLLWDIRDEKGWALSAHIILPNKVIILYDGIIRLHIPSSNSSTVILNPNQKHKTSACATEEKLYVSMLAIDIANWPVDDSGYNGTWEYTFSDGCWRKVSEKYFDYLTQFDERYLWGIDEWGRIEQIDLLE